MTRKTYHAYAYGVIRVRRQAGLDRQNFGSKYDFSILFSRFLWSGKFILAISIFGRLFIYIYNKKGFVKHETLPTPQCRKLAEESFEMMKNISRENI